jgi:hypothetical protein
LETAFEIYDYFAMFVPLYPYRSDNVKPEIKGALCFHHVPSIISAYLIFETGLYENPHLQWVALSLLMGGAVSATLGAIVYFIDMGTLSGSRIIAALTLFNTIFFVFCRFVIFPMESFRLIQDVTQHPDILESNPWAVYVFGFDAMVFSVFNVAILVDLIPRVKLWIQRAQDGVTLIHTGPVGSSRDSILGVKRRRSSVLQIAKDVAQKRSSLFLAANGFQVDISPEEAYSTPTLSAVTANGKWTKDSHKPLVELTEEEQSLIDEGYVHDTKKER